MTLAKSDSRDLYKIDKSFYQFSSGLSNQSLFTHRLFVISFGDLGKDVLQNVYTSYIIDNFATSFDD